jgi:hypothetical protein
MSTTEKTIIGTDEAWEDRRLGATEKHAKPFEQQDDVDNDLCLQMISIRLQKSLIEELKIIAKVHGIGYQPLIRDVLQRFSHAELKKLMSDYAEKIARGEISAPEEIMDNRQCA